MNKLELEEYYLEKKCLGMEYSNIREELKSRNVSTEDIRIIIRSIDDRILKDEMDKSFELKGNESLIIGIFLLLGGLTLSIGSYTGFIYLKGYFIIAYGPVLTGIVLIASHKLKSKYKPNNKSNSKFGRFRK